MTHTHTPAPWGCYNQKQSGYYRIETPDGHPIGSAINYDDGRLMAAAPELLEAHIAVDDEIGKRMAEIEAGEWDNEQIVNMLVYLQNTSRAAIAKAQGVDCG